MMPYFVEQQCPIYITWEHSSQGEEQDNSDEEWENEYAAMDPILQLGGGNRRGVVEGLADELVADVFVAADMLHSKAMSQIGGSSHFGDACAGHMDANTAGNVSPPPQRIVWTRGRAWTTTTKVSVGFEPLQ